MTLIEVIVIIAVFAILAGVIIPVAWNAMTKARIEATNKELDTLKNALLRFYKDNNTFPFDTCNDNGDGLAALFNPNPGLYPNWNGPYVSAATRDDLTKDTWGNLYIYDRKPKIGGNENLIDALVYSVGPDGIINGAGGCGENWAPSSSGDDLFVMVSAKEIDAEKSKYTSEYELLAFRDALLAFYRDNNTFPYDECDDGGTGLSALIAQDPINPYPHWKGPYITSATEKNLGVDFWGREYIYDRLPNIGGTYPVDAIVYSKGANGVIDSAGGCGLNWIIDPAGDDLYIMVTSKEIDWEKYEATIREIDKLEAALINYYRDMWKFPAQQNQPIGDCRDFSSLFYSPTPLSGGTPTPTPPPAGTPTPGWRGPYLNADDTYCYDEWDVEYGYRYIKDIYHPSAYDKVCYIIFHDEANNEVERAIYAPW